MVGKTRCKVARRMAQWAFSQDDEHQQGVGGSNNPVKQNGLSSNDKIPRPLMDCGQGKNKNNGVSQRNVPIWHCNVAPSGRTPVGVVKNGMPNKNRQTVVKRGDVGSSGSRAAPIVQIY